MRLHWLLLAFLLGLWCNSDSAARVGYQAGVWTRQVLGLRPVAVIVYSDFDSVGPFMPCTASFGSSKS